MKPTAREMELASKLFTKPFDGNWTQHIAQAFAAYREELVQMFETAESADGVERGDGFGGAVEKARYG